MCRVGGHGTVLHCSSTVLAWFWYCPSTVLAWFWYCSGPVPALVWPGRALTDTSVYALVHHGRVRVFRVDPATTHPGYTPPASRRHPESGRAPAACPRCQDRPWGSLLAAPEETCTRLVTWPVTGPGPAPLIGTLCLPPCVTLAGPLRAITQQYVLIRPDN